MRPFISPTSLYSQQTKSPLILILETDVDYDRHKKDSLAKQKRGAGHWKPELASDSEEAVRADRASREGPREDVHHLQERTKKAAEETAKGGTSMRDGM